MSLPLPNLDSRTFQDLAEELRKLIPGYAPEWTDSNVNDRGVTCVQVLAQLTETVFHRLKMLPTPHIKKLLRLLGNQNSSDKQAQNHLRNLSEDDWAPVKETQVLTTMMCRFGRLGDHWAQRRAVGSDEAMEVEADIARRLYIMLRCRDYLGENLWKCIIAALHLLLFEHDDD